ncbi:MAG: glycosyltransferase [Bacteroidetes bacterium]|jgi:glycosyltransferase involved in cell wall biosynthesis|nr:glycosyltransferase [Bacteroidota bacterium]
MKVTVITAVYNSASTIRDTLESVFGQDYSDIEYVVIDGASTDNTLSIIKSYSNRISTIISESDRGIYDAINKGIRAATGDVIAILHADDVFANSQVLSHVVHAMGSNNVDAVYGDLLYVQRENLEKVVRHWKSGTYHHGLFRKGWMPPHPSFFLKRSCYEQYGLYTDKLVSAADYELMLRMLHKHRVSVAYLPEVLVRMRVGGVSNKSVNNRIRANREDREAWRMNGLQPGLLTLIRKPLSKLKQFIFKR